MYFSGFVGITTANQPSAKCKMMAMGKRLQFCTTTTAPTSTTTAAGVGAGAATVNTSIYSVCRIVVVGGDGGGGGDDGAGNGCYSCC